MGVGVVFVAFATVGLSIGIVYYSSIFYTVHTPDLPESRTRYFEAIIGAGGAGSLAVSAGASRVTAAVSAASPAIGPLVSLSPFALCAFVVAGSVVVSWRMLTPRG
jgi:hypothetical protein